MNVLYTGSGAEASRLAFSKSAAKERLFQRGVTTPPYVLVHESDDPRRTLELALRIGFPLVVKPDGQGSSLGVSIVKSAGELPAALQKCFQFDVFGLLEQAIPGTEWTVGLLDDEPLPLIQIETPREFFDFTAKYEDDATVCRFEFAVAGACRLVHHRGGTGRRPGGRYAGPGTRRHAARRAEPPLGAGNQHDSRIDRTQPGSESGCSRRHQPGRVV